MDSKIILAIVAVAAIAVVGGAAVMMNNGGNGGSDEGWSVEYQGNGGSYDGQTSFTVESEPVISTNRFVYDGYTFVSWNTAADGSGTEYLPGASLKVSTTLYAQWIPVLAISSLSEMNDPSIAFSVSVDGGRVVPIEPGFVVPLAGDAVIYIVGLDAAYLGAYDMNERGRFVFEYDDRCVVVSCSVDSVRVLSSGATIDGDTLAIAISSDGPHRFSNTLSPVIVRYYDGSDYVDSCNLDHDTMMFETADCMFEKEGYVFTGWNEKADGTGTVYMPGDEFNIVNKRLYAQWELL